MTGLGPGKCPCHVQDSGDRLEVLWSPPKAAAFHDSDGPFKEGMYFKLGLHTPDFHGKGKKKDLMVFPCPALEMLRERAFVKHHLEQPGLATWLSQATRSEANQAEDGGLN